MKSYVRSVAAGLLILLCIANVWVAFAVVALVCVYALVRWTLEDFPNDDR